jgi:drug/metabolite transporter (DMT)-like permease
MVAGIRTRGTSPAAGVDWSVPPDTTRPHRADPYAPPHERSMPEPVTPSNRSRPMSALEWAILFTLSVIWGGAFFFNAVAVAEIPVFTVVVSRVAIAAIVLYALLRLTGRTMPTDGCAWAAFFGMGLLNNVIPFTLIVWGQQHIASGVASILNASAPLFTVFLAHLLTDDEKLSGGRLAGVVIGFAGVAAWTAPRRWVRTSRRSSPASRPLAPMALPGSSGAASMPWAWRPWRPPPAR